jgi:hypothetical protein
MGVLAIQLDGAGLRAARTGADGLVPVDGEDTLSPAVAVLTDRVHDVGLAGLAQACLRPSAVRSGFWDRLDTQPIDAKRPGSPSSAELAFRHLEHAVRRLRPGDDEVVLAVPPILRDDQLAYLVQMTLDLGLEAAALVPSPLAGALPDDLAGPAIMLGIGWRSAAFSVLDVGDEVVLRGVSETPDVGLDAVRRRWTRAIGGEFLRATRFDPLHDAATEQQVLDALPRLLDELSGAPSTSLEIRAGEREHRATITSQLMAQAAQPLILALTAGLAPLVREVDPAAILLGADAGAIPGLRHAVERQTSRPVHTLPEGAAALGLVRLWPAHFPKPGAPGAHRHAWRRRAPAAVPSE